MADSALRSGLRRARQNGGGQCGRPRPNLKILKSNFVGSAVPRPATVSNPATDAARQIVYLTTLGPYSNISTLGGGYCDRRPL
mgnify:CR=1 FL=1